MLLDLHTHHPRPAADVFSVANVAWAHDAWPSPSGQACSVGIHPWYLPDAARQDTRKQLLEAARLPAVVAIGECGLDRVCASGWATQVLDFQLCIELAQLVQKPLILHCVRAFDELLQQKKQTETGRTTPSVAWVLHGFDKHPQVATMLLRAGCYLSFGAALLRDGHHAREALRITPLDRFFLETDVWSAGDIGDIYGAAAAVKGLTVEAVEAQVWANWERVSATDALVS
jgi:TatD DNase family protein